MSRSFAGKKVIVIGGSSGMGFAVAKLAPERGGEALIVGRCAQKLDTAAAALGAFGPVTGLQSTLPIPIRSRRCARRSMPSTQMPIISSMRRAC
jgi:NAD(P)-dependent dehydrogenase (short-subunit alcohol dehydrogenase family)